MTKPSNNLFDIWKHHPADADVCTDQKNGGTL